MYNIETQELAFRGPVMITSLPSAQGQGSSWVYHSSCTQKEDHTLPGAPPVEVPVVCPRGWEAGSLFLRKKMSGSYPEGLLWEVAFKHLASIWVTAHGPPREAPAPSEANQQVTAPEGCWPEASLPTPASTSRRPSPVQEVASSLALARASHTSLPSTLPQRLH